MHMKKHDNQLGPANVKIIFHMEDPEPLTGNDEPVIEAMAARGEHILEVALEAGINIEHACGGVCACSTCHVYVEDGEDDVNEASEDEEDRVEEAPGLKYNSRLSCQTIVQGDGPIEIKIPAWNRNAVKETPH